MRLIFVRHGEPNYKEDCLTPTGHEQAKLAAERLKGEGIEKIFSSPMGRAYQTAEYTAKALGFPDIEVLDFMHEITWGSTDGSPVFHDGNPWYIADEMAERGMDLWDTDWEQGEFFRNNTCVENVHMIEREFDKFLLTLGQRREGRHYRTITETDNDHTYVLFSHGGSSCAAISHILGLTFPFSCASLHMPFTAICVIRFDSRPNAVRVPIMELMNDARHIELT